MFRNQKPQKRQEKRMYIGVKIFLFNLTGVCFATVLEVFFIKRHVTHVNQEKNTYEGEFENK